MNLSRELKCFLFFLYIRIKTNVVFFRWNYLYRFLCECHKIYQIMRNEKQTCHLCLTYSFCFMTGNLKKKANNSAGEWGLSINYMLVLGFSFTITDFVFNNRLRQRNFPIRQEIYGYDALDPDRINQTSQFHMMIINIIWQKIWESTRAKYLLATEFIDDKWIPRLQADIFALVNSHIFVCSIHVRNYEVCRIQSTEVHMKCISY